ncbi:hypothetical protein SVIOM74S_01670 [Streptomyces violarus]
MTPIRQGRNHSAALASAMCALAVTGTVLTGCAEDPNEGTNGVGRLSAEKIQAKTRSVAESAGAVRVHGNVVSGERTYALDMRLKDDGGEGSVTSEGVMREDVAGLRVASYVAPSLRSDTRDGRTTARRSRIIDMAGSFATGNERRSTRQVELPGMRTLGPMMFGTSTKRGAPHRRGGESRY